MRFGILGPLLVAGEADAEIPVAGTRLRVLLAALVVRANRVVSVDELAETVWDGAPPAEAVRTVRRYVVRLRAAVGPVVAGRILTRNPGYVFQAAEDEVDLLRFETLCREGGAAVRAQAWPEAADLLSEAQGLWRGSPLEDVASQVLRDAWLPRLEQLRLQALEWRIEADLHLGRRDHLIPELQALVGEYPFREQAHAQLMLALFRSGRQGEALAAYQDARRVLVAELGVEPGARLRELHQQILTGDPAISASPPEPPHDIGPAADPAYDVAVVPRQMPAAIAHFTGRADAFLALDGLARQAAGARAASTVISVIGGSAGIGKTALAVQWGQQNTDLFPDGQLYVNLRGYDPAGAPVKPSAAIRGFLQSLGIPPAQVPSSQDAQAALYRSLLAGRRMLILLDNAYDSEHVRPLLPGSAGSLVLVTSRSLLTGLVAVDGAHPLTVGLLTADEARDLLTRRLGAIRATAEPGAVDELAELCARVPLALNIAAARAIARPDAPLAALVSQLRDSHGRLAALDTGDGATSVRAAFSWSLRDLDADAACAFRLAGLQPGPDLDRYATAALAGVTPEHAVDLMDRLARAHLLSPAGPVRFGMHDLLRVYARELAADADGDAGCQAALTRLFDYYLYTASTAMNILFPSEDPRRPSVSPLAVAAPLLTGGAGARAWLDAERASLTAVTRHAAERGWPGHAVRLAATLARYLDTGCYYSEALAIHAGACHAARSTGDRGAEGIALIDIGTVHWRQGRDQRASSCYQQALSLFRQVGDRTGEARSLHSLGLIDHAQGGYQEAVGFLRQALDLFRELGDRIGEAHALGNLGDKSRLQGRYEQATGFLRQALDLFRELGDRVGEAHVLIDLGDISRRQGRHERTADCLHRALKLSREESDLMGEVHALNCLGDASRWQDRHPQAVSYHQQALDLSRQAAYPSGEAEALNGLGEAFLALGRPGPAKAQHTRALILARHIGNRALQASACHGLARAYHATADHGQAGRYWQKALALYTSLGAAEADQVRAQLTAATAAS